MNCKNWCFRNLANIITGIRIKLCFLLIFLGIFHREQMGWIFFWGMVVLLTDGLDGFVARRFEIVSKFGASLDRFADKLFEFTMFAIILTDSHFDVWLKASIYPMVVIEVLLLVVWYLGVVKKMDVSAGIWGKLKMCYVSTGIMACPLVIIVSEHDGTSIPFFMTQILILIFMISFGFGVMSFKKHISQYREQL
jgi:phosphatidylglycerophosphate synthase